MRTWFCSPSISTIRLKKPDFVGFGIQYFIGNATHPRDVFNFLTFKRVRLAAKAAKPDAGTYRFCFSPHKKAALSMKPLADAIDDAKKSVFYAVAFCSAQSGPADKALDALDPKKLLVMGVANMAGKPKSTTLLVQLPGRGPIPFGPAALTKNMPEPFKSEWTGGGGIHMHHKFVICDFNGDKPVVFTGSSNLAAGGEQGNGDNLIEICAKGCGRLCRAGSEHFRSLRFPQPHEKSQDQACGAGSERTAGAGKAGMVGGQL